MPIDASDYIRRLRLVSQQNANRAADPKKFRAPTRDTVYDPYRVVKNSIVLDDFKNPSPQHNMFGSQQFHASYPGAVFPNTFTPTVTFTTSNASYAIPAGYLFMDLYIVGGGGGGGSGTSSPQAGGGGGGGGFTRVMNLAIANQTLSVTVGLGGVGGTAPGNDGNFGGSSFVQHNLISYTATGGNGGSGGNQNGVGGTGGSGTISGSAGTDGVGVTPGTGGNSGYSDNPLIGKGGDGAYLINAASGTNGVVIVVFHN